MNDLLAQSVHYLDLKWAFLAAADTRTAAGVYKMATIEFNILLGLDGVQIRIYLQAT